jgi:hypothetical protein
MTKEARIGPAMAAGALGAQGRAAGQTVAVAADRDAALPEG